MAKVVQTLNFTKAAITASRRSPFKRFVRWTKNLFNKEARQAVKSNKAKALEDGIGVSTTIHDGQQGKHIIGHNNYVAERGRSILSSDAQSLLDDFHSGNFNSARTINKDKVSVDFGKEIGTFIDSEGNALPTTVGTIHTSQKGSHIIPGRPISD